MGLIEAILMGLQFKSLQKPLVFFSMLIALILFSIFGFGIVGALIESLVNSKQDLTTEAILPSLGLLAISMFFFVLASVCGYFIKRCFE